MLTKLWSFIGIKGIQHYLEGRDITEEEKFEAKKQLKIMGYVAIEDETSQQRTEREASELLDDLWEATSVDEMVAYLNYPLATQEGRESTITQMGLRGYKAVLKDDLRPAVCRDFAG
jgi:hypothetical protein